MSLSAGEIELVAYANVDDAGYVVDHASVQGQVHGGVMQDVGKAPGERAICDSETGQLLTGSFIDYPMPRADWMQGMRCGEHNVPTKSNALGAKGVGESGTSGALPAVMNAATESLIAFATAPGSVAADGRAGTMGCAMPRRLTT